MCALLVLGLCDLQKILVITSSPPPPFYPHEGSTSLPLTNGFLYYVQESYTGDKETLHAVSIHSRLTRE